MNTALAGRLIARVARLAWPVVFLSGSSVLAQTPAAPPPPSTDAPLPGTHTLLEDTNLLVLASNQFAFDLYRQFNPAPADNAFFSPYSISSALAMTYAGARNETAIQMASALHLSGLAAGPLAFVEMASEQQMAQARQRIGQPGPGIPRLFGNLQQNLAAAQSKGGLQLAIANSLWPGQDAEHPLVADYLKIVQDNFKAGIFPADFRTQAAAARTRINAWVADHTNDKIKDLLQSGDVGVATRLVLVNAIYFKGAWATPFNPKASLDGQFQLAGGGAQPVVLMSAKLSAGYAVITDAPVPLQILSLPYHGGDLSFVALLPDAPDGLPALEKSLSASQLATWLGQLTNRDVQVFLPRFKLTRRYSLAPALRALGMTDAFTVGVADFSGMDGAHDLFISAAVHQAFVDVNEEGTEAAAATGVVMRTLAVQVPVVFRADHPFLFLIRDNTSGTILFLGRLASPPPAQE